MMEDTAYDFTGAKRIFSKIGLSLCVILILATVFQVLVVAVPVWIWGPDNVLMTTSWGMWLCTFVPLYLIAIPVGLLMLRRLPGAVPQENSLSLKEFLKFFPMAFCLMYTGNLIGTYLSGLLSGGTAENAVMEYAMDNNPLKVLVMVILAPLLEEYVFRKQIIDRTRQYGEKTAVFLSAFTFGLFHMNLFQFFYAFGLGWLFAYIYVRTGRLRYPVILHGIINFMGSVLAPYLLTLIDLDAMANMDPNAAPEELMALYTEMMSGMAVYMLYAMFLLVMSIAGLIMLLKRRRKLIWKEAEAQLPSGTEIKTVYGNVGMVLFVAVCLVFIVIALL